MEYAQCENCGKYLGNRSGIEANFDGDTLDFCNDKEFQDWLRWETNNSMLADYIYSHLDADGEIEDVDWHQLNEDAKDQRQLERYLDKQRL